MIRILDLGTMPYRAAWKRQVALLERRVAGRAPDTILFVEHEPVITVGRRRGAARNVLDPGDTPVIQVERGGDATWHGPGQLVAWPVVALPPDRRDLHRFLRLLEEAAIRTCAALGLEAGRDPRNTGAWIRGRKVCSIGIACRRWVTWHGMALNVDPPMSAFQALRPCGLDPGLMTSLSAELGRPVELGPVRELLARQLVELLSEWPGCPASGGPTRSRRGPG